MGGAHVLVNVTLNDLATSTVIVSCWTICEIDAFDLCVNASNTSPDPAGSLALCCWNLDLDLFI